MDCMKALTESAGDVEKSKEYLRKKGLAYAEKRADRLATQGLVGFEQGESCVTMVQLACETDFVAKTDQFRVGLEAILASLHQTDGLKVELSKSADFDFIERITKEVQLKKSLDPAVEKQSIQEGIKFVISKTQENCQLARVFKAQFDSGKGQVCSTYLHNKSAPGIGKIASIFVSPIANLFLVDEIWKTRT